MNSLIPLVLDLTAADRRSADAAVLDVTEFETFRSDHLLSEDELEEHLRRFNRHCEVLDRPLTEEQEERNFARFFEMVQEALMNVGTFSESRMDEADFTARRDVDAAHVLRVKAAVPITPEIVVTTMGACVSMGSDYAVIFDGREGRSVLFSNGDWVRGEG